MKRLIKKADQHSFISNFRPGMMNSPSPTQAVKVPTSSEELAEGFKNWFVTNWINQGNDPNNLKYVGNLPKTVFRAWISTVKSGFSNVTEPMLDQSEFLLQSERILR